MNPEDFLDPGTVLNLNARDQWHAISELLDALVAAGKITARNRPEIENAVRRREMAMSTGIGSGIGLPHTLTELVKEPVAAFGRSKRGINFDAPDKKPVFKVCLFLTPRALFSKHTQFLAAITKLLATRDF